MPGDSGLECTAEYTRTDATTTAFGQSAILVVSTAVRSWLTCTPLMRRTMMRETSSTRCLCSGESVVRERHGFSTKERDIRENRTRGTYGARWVKLRFLAGWEWGASSQCSLPFKPFHSSSVPCATTDSDQAYARSWNENSMDTFSAFRLPTDFRKQKPPIAQNSMSVLKVQHEEINQRAAEHRLCAEPERHANTSDPQHFEQ